MHTPRLAAPRLSSLGVGGVLRACDPPRCTDVTKAVNRWSAGASSSFASCASFSDQERLRFLVFAICKPYILVPTACVLHVLRALQMNAQLVVSLRRRGLSCSVCPPRARPCAVCKRIGVKPLRCARTRRSNDRPFPRAAVCAPPMRPWDRIATTALRVAAGLPQSANIDNELIPTRHPHGQAWRRTWCPWLHRDCIALGLRARAALDV